MLSVYFVARPFNATTHEKCNGIEFSAATVLFNVAT